MRSVGHGAPGDERVEEASRQLDSVQLCAADPACVRSIVMGVQDAGYHLAEVVVDHVCQSWRSVAIDTSHVSDDPDKKSGLLQDLAHTGVFGRFVRSAAPARNGPIGRVPAAGPGESGATGVDRRRRFHRHKAADQAA